MRRLCHRCLNVYTECVSNHTINVLGVKTVESEESDAHRPVLFTPELPTNTCKEHHGKMIEMYCEEHDEVCCAVCIAMKHRLCKKVEYIPNVAKKLLQEQDRQNAESNLDETKRDLFSLRSIQSVFLKELNKQRNEIIKDIHQFKAMLVKRIEELEDTTISEVETRYKTITDDMSRDMEKVDQMLNDIETHFNKLKQSRSDDVAKLFVNMKLAEQQVSIGNNFKTELFGKPLQRMDYERNVNIENLLKNAESLINFTRNHHCKIILFRLVNAKRHSLVGELNDKMKQRILAVNILLDLNDVAKTIFIPFVHSETDNYTYQKSDKRHALMLVSEIISK